MSKIVEELNELAISKQYEQGDIRNNFRRNDSLLRRKLYSYLPYLFLTNLSSLLLVSVDGLVVGNLVGSSALSSVNVFSPVITAIGVFSGLIAMGISTMISTAMGNNEIDELSYLKKAARTTMIVSAFAIGVIQIPIAYALLSTYNLSPEFKHQVWQYGLGVMISMPFGLISTVGVYEMQILGKAKVLAVLAGVEGGLNLIFDLIFVGAFHMGVAGAGFGTAAANVVRCTITVLYLAKKTDIYKCGDAKLRLKDVKLLITSGISESSYSLMMAVQSYFMIRILLFVFGESAGVINEVCVFCLSLVDVIILSVTGSARPLAGIFTGANDVPAVRMLIRQCVLLLSVLGGLVTLAVFSMTEFFFTIHGVTEIPEHGIMSLRLFTLCFIFRGIDAIFRLYFANQKDNTYSTTATVLGYAALPVLAFIIPFFLPQPFLWTAYLITEFAVLIANLCRYVYWIKKNKEPGISDDQTIYLSVTPEDAIEASREVREYAKEHGYSEKLAYRAALCMEEMVHYAKAVAGTKEVDIQIILKFFADSCVFAMIDDGECIMLNEDDASRELITNYGLIRKIARNVSYQYVLDMNYTVFTFQ